jgi:hypothetical protein
MHLSTKQASARPSRQSILQTRTSGVYAQRKQYRLPRGRPAFRTARGRLQQYIRCRTRWNNYATISSARSPLSLDLLFAIIMRVRVFHRLAKILQVIELLSARWRMRWHLHGRICALPNSIALQLCLVPQSPVAFRNVKQLCKSAYLVCSAAMWPAPWTTGSPRTLRRQRMVGSSCRRASCQSWILPRPCRRLCWH